MSRVWFTTIVLFIILLGCVPVQVGPVSTDDHIGLHGGPSIQEEYAVRGTVTISQLISKPISGARVTVYLIDKKIGTVTTDTSGKFIIPVGNSVDNPIAVHSLGTDGTANHGGAEVVVHNFAGIQTHDHYNVDVVIEADGYKNCTVNVEVPRNTSAPSLEVILTPLRVPQTS